MKPFTFFIKKNGIGAMDRKTFNVLRNYLITELLPNQKDVNWRLMDAAHKLQLKDLEFFCISSLLGRLNFDNAIHFLFKSQYCDSYLMKVAVLHVTALRVKELLQNPNGKIIKNYHVKMQATLCFINVFLQIYEERAEKNLMYK